MCYNYKSNPILPDSDFDGRLDWKDKNKLNNDFEFQMETDVEDKEAKLRPYDIDDTSVALASNLYGLFSMYNKWQYDT